MQSSMLKAIVEDFGNGGTIDGDLVVSGDLTVSGGGSLSFDEILEGTQVIDVTSTEALLVRKNGDGGDVLTVDTDGLIVTIGAKTIIKSASAGAGQHIKLYETTSAKYYMESVSGTFQLNDRTGAGTQPFKSVTGVTNTLVLNNGNVGIGTDSPSYTLDVSGSIRALSGSLFLSGANPVKNVNSALLLDAASSQYIALRPNNGVEAMRIDSSGNVGIGTTSPAAMLEVSGAAALIQATYTGASSAGVGGVFRAVQNDGAAMTSGHKTGYFLMGGARDGADNISYTSSINSFATENWSAGNLGTKMTFETTADGSGSRATAMTIDQDGNVGIGVTDPVSILEVAKSGSPHLTLSQGGTEGINADEVIGLINFYSRDATTTSTGGVGQIGVYGETNFDDQETPSYMAFYTHPDVANDASVLGATTEKMRITAAGNVGIGTESPSTALHIDGTSGGLIKLTKTTGATSGELGAVQFGNVDVDNYLAAIRSFQDGATDSARIAFYTEATGDNLTERMRISSTGNVGIGITPAERFDIKTTSGDCRIRLDAPASSDTEIKFYNAGSAQYTIGHDDATDNFVIGGANVDAPMVSVDKSGNVGIGIDAPAAALDVVGDVRIKTANGTQTYEFNRLAAVGPTALALESQTSGVGFGLALRAKDQDGTDTVALQFIGKQASDFSTRERMIMGWDAANSYYQIQTEEAGETLRPIHIFTEGNANQLVAAIDGNVGIGTAVPANPLAVNRSGDGVIVDFESADAVEGTVSISGTTTSYNAFVGSHYTQLKDGQNDLPVGAVVSSTGEIITCNFVTEAIDAVEAVEAVEAKDAVLDDDGNITEEAVEAVAAVEAVEAIEATTTNVPNKEYFTYINTTTTQSDPAVYGTWMGKMSDDAKGHSFGDDEKPIYLVAQVGLFKIRVTDTNGNIANGDYLESSTRAMEGQKQTSNAKVNSTIGKAMIDVDWSSIDTDSELGYKWKLIPCTF